MGTAAPAMMPTTEELEAAIAELPAKKDGLREAFDCLAARSPYPLPFTWEDLDAHVSSVQSSISRRFSQLRALEAARPARTSKNKEGANEVGEEEVEVVEEEEEEEEAEEEEEEEEAEEEEEEEKEEEEADKQMQEVEGDIGNDAADAEEGGEDFKRDADEEEAVTAKVFAGQGEEAEGEEELDGYAQWDGEEQDTDEEMVEKMTKKQFRRLPACGIKEFAEACGRMDAGKLVEFLICFNVNKKSLVALYLAPDPAALVLQVVKLLLSSKDFKYSKVWGKCIRLLRWLSMNSVKHSADTTEQAKLVAKDWKEMLSRPGCCEELLLPLLARVLLQFLISYNIVSEFNIREIINIFAMVPRKGQKNKNTFIVKFCEDLGLADRATDLIDYMIGNGQHLQVFNLVQIFNLEDKYPPFYLLKGYIDKVKKTSVEIFRKNETQKSLNLAIQKDLRIAHQLAEQKLADSRQRGAIMAEIGYLIGAYKKKERSENFSTPSTWDSQHQPTKHKKKNKKHEKEELEHHEAQVNQQQQAQNENKLIQGKQHQLHQHENKAQVTEQQQQQHMQPPRPPTLKLPTPAVPRVLNVAQIQNFGRPPYAAMPGVHNYPAQPGWPVGQGMPFVPQFRSPQYMGPPFNPFTFHPPSYPR